MEVGGGRTKEAEGENEKSKSPFGKSGFLLASIKEKVQSGRIQCNKSTVFKGQVIPQIFARPIFSQNKDERWQAITINENKLPSTKLHNNTTKMLRRCHAF